MCLRLLHLEYFIVRCSQRRKRRGTPRVNVKSLRTWEEEINEQCRQPSGSRQNRSIYISSRVFLFTVLILSPLDGYSKSTRPHHDTHSLYLHLSVYTSGAIAAIKKTDPNGGCIMSISLFLFLLLLILPSLNAQSCSDREFPLPQIPETAQQRSPAARRQSG